MTNTLTQYELDNLAAELDCYSTCDVWHHDDALDVTIATDGRPWYAFITVHGVTISDSMDRTVLECGFSDGSIARIACNILTRVEKLADAR